MSVREAAWSSRKAGIVHQVIGSGRVQAQRLRRSLVAMCSTAAVPRAGPYLTQSRSSKSRCNSVNAKEPLVCSA